MNDLPAPERLSDAVTLYEGRCEDVLPHMPASAVVVSDPPYGIAHQHSSLGNAAKGRRSNRRFGVKIDGDDKPFDPTPWLKWPCILFGADHYCDKLPAGGVMHVWDKAYSGGPSDSFSDAELFWTSWRCARRVVRYLWKGVCQDGEKGRRKFHPSQKPEFVMRSLVKMTDAETIIDPYAGSGTTGVASVVEGRQCILIEQDPAYCKIIRKRISDAEANGPGSLFTKRHKPAGASLFDEAA